MSAVANVTGNNIFRNHTNGAITVSRSNVTFGGYNTISYNHAGRNAILVTNNSEVRFHGSTNILNNIAVSGGGITLVQSLVFFIDNTTFKNNIATSRGGVIISVESSSKGTQHSPITADS